jgi:hypothetical protein
MNHDRLKILKRLEAGEITAEQADALLASSGKRGPKPKAKQPKASRNGRPIDYEQRKLILAYWVMYHDKMPKQRLKEILSDALNVDISVIVKRIAEINRVARKHRDILILRDEERGIVMAGTRVELSRMLRSGIVQKPP